MQSGDPAVVRVWRPLGPAPRDAQGGAALCVGGASGGLRVPPQVHAVKGRVPAQVLKWVEITWVSFHKCLKRIIGFCFILWRRNFKVPKTNTMTSENPPILWYANHLIIKFCHMTMPSNDFFSDKRKHTYSPRHYNALKNITWDIQFCWNALLNDFSLNLFQIGVKLAKSLVWKRSSMSF